MYAAKNIVDREESMIDKVYEKLFLIIWSNKKNYMEQYLELYHVCMEIC